MQVKASQCFTKYKWRSAEEAATDGGPEIVATQVVSDYLTPYDGEMLMMQAKDRPVVVYTYRMTFRSASMLSLQHHIVALSSVAYRSVLARHCHRWLLHRHAQSRSPLPCTWNPWSCLMMPVLPMCRRPNVNF